MSLYKSITTEQALKSEKSRILSYLENKLSITFKSQRKQNEVVSGILGAADWNTLIASVRSSQDTTKSDDKVNIGQMLIDCIHFNLGFKAESVIQDMNSEFDDIVFDYYGTSQDVSDTINNMGLEVQLNSLQQLHKVPITQSTIAMFLREDVWSLFTETSGLTVQDVMDYICHPSHEHGVCTTCGASNHAGRFCSKKTCCKHELNDSGEKRLEVFAYVAFEQGGGERDFYHIDIADYFYAVKAMPQKHWDADVKSLAKGVLDTADTVHRVLRKLANDSKARSTAYNIFENGLIVDGYSSHVVDKDNMLKIMGQTI